jgi:inner membrane protein
MCQTRVNTILNGGAMNNSTGRFRVPGLKYLILILMGLFLLIPLGMIRGVVEERRMRKISVAEEIQGFWGARQTIAGPYLVIPYLYTYTDAEGVPRRGRAELYLMPEELRVAGELLPESRSRGIYTVSLFLADLRMEGSFTVPSPAALGIPAEDLMLDRARLYIGVSDVRGIRDAGPLLWGNESISFEPGEDPLGRFSGAIWAPVSPDPSTAGGGPMQYSVRLNLACGGALLFVPAGRSSIVSLDSSWPSPSYTGAYLPVTHAHDEEGFSARWEISALGRSFPMSWTSQEGVEGYAESSFGLEFFEPVDIYALSQRAVKYGLLFILVPFLIFCIAEMLTRIRVHPVQYLIAVSANLIFFLLLLSLSEHIPFTLAFVLAAGGVGMELFLFSWLAMRSLKLGLGMLLASSGLYGFLFTALKSEDYALLIGSVGLFVIVGMVMLLTRGVRWYGPGD